MTDRQKMDFVKAMFEMALRLAESHGIVVLLRRSDDESDVPLWFDRLAFRSTPENKETPRES